ncbi:MAG: hypothetical protein IT487_08265 [Chromatiaceae bacterium]|nr:hypothetical protein [Chromatiaceae bacterium]
MTTYIDGHLLGLADGDDREAVRVVAAIARDRLGPLVGDDDALGYALRVMERLAGGETVPKPARQRPLGHLAWMQWMWAEYVAGLIRDDGMNESRAITAVAYAAKKSRDVIYDAWAKYRDVEAPTDLFPLPSEVRDALPPTQPNLDPLTRERLTAAAQERQDEIEKEWKDFEDRLAVARKTHNFRP